MTDCAGQSAESSSMGSPDNPTNNSNGRNADIVMVAAISGGSAALGLVLVLLAMAVFGICSRKCRKGRYTFDQTQPIQRSEQVANCTGHGSTLSVYIQYIPTQYL